MEIPGSQTPAWEPHPRNSVSRSGTGRSQGCGARRNRVSRTGVTKRSLVTRRKRGEMRECQILHRHNASRLTNVNFPGFVQRRAPRDPLRTVVMSGVVANTVHRTNLRWHRLLACAALAFQPRTWGFSRYAGILGLPFTAGHQAHRWPLAPFTGLPGWASAAPTRHQLAQAERREGP